MKIKRTIYNLSALVFLCCCAVCFGASEQDEAVTIVLDILKSDDQEMQAVAIAMVKDMPGMEVTKALIKELPKLSAASQVQLLSALSDRGDNAALPAVITAVNEGEESVRIAALKAVGQLGDNTSVDLLARTAAATRGAEQKAARESLYRLRGSKVDEAILVGITKAQPKAKVELIKSAGERNISTGVSTLLKTAKDSDRKVRLESLKVLKVVAGPEHLPALVELLLNLQSSSDLNEARKMIASVAHKIEDKNHQAEAVLAVLPSVKDVKKQCSLLSVLGKIGDSNALPRLREALGSDDVNIKGAAIRALAEWPTSEPAADLMKAAENSKNKVHRILALRGSVRLLVLDDKRSSKETIGMYKKAMTLTPDAGEKKRVLSGLANIKSLDALQMATGYLQDKALLKEAESAVVTIAGSIYENFPQQTKVVLEKIVRTTGNEALQKQAQEVINKIEGLGKQVEE
ncbi:MAG: HEAT repeat domain-containing protein [Planctomycetes bacterium]|nr:HEAT repeat domain-containing protein [Planctomycetota bacterium]